MKYQRYERYKTTNIEWLKEIPEDWDVERIKFNYHVINGATPSSRIPEYWDGDVLWATPGDISSIVKHIYDTKRKLTMEGLYNCGATISGKNSIILTTRAPIGNVAIMGNPMCVNQGCRILRKSSEEQSEDYLFYYLKGLKELLISLGSGSTFRELSTNALATMEFVKPPFDTQVKIADYLDREIHHIDSLIQEKAIFLSLLKEKRERIISQVVTKGLNPNMNMKDSGIEDIGEIPEDWGIKRLKHCCLVNPVKKNFELSSDERTLVAFLPMEKVSENGDFDVDSLIEISEVNIGYTYFERNDVILAKITPCFENGKAALLDELVTEFGFGSTEFIVFRPTDEVLPGYLYFLVTNILFRQLGEASMKGSAGQKRITTEFCSNFKYGIPPIETQHQIIEFLKGKIELSRETESEIIRSIALLKEKRDALVSSVVTGQVKVTEEMMYESQ